MSPIHLNRKIVENFKWPLSQICSNFILSLLKSGEPKIAKMVVVHWPRWPPCPYMVKPFKNLLLQNWGCLGTESVHKSSGTGDLPKLLKRLWYIDIWPFYGKVKFASLSICMSPITFVWENCWEFQTTSPLKSLSQICSDFYLTWASSALGELLWSVNVRRPWWVMWHASCGVNNYFKSLFFLRLWVIWLDTW